MSCAVLAQSKRHSLKGGNAGTIKDEINDLIKGSGALAKDIVTSSMKAASEHGTDIKVADAMQMIAQGWRKTIEKSAEKLFDGSEDSVLKLTLLISDVAMIEKKVISEPNPGEALGSLKKTLNSQLIPLDEAGCISNPKDWFIWQEDSRIACGAYNRRVCGDFTGGIESPRCAGFHTPPGYSLLESNTCGLNVRDVVEGSINRWIANDRKNGGAVKDPNDSILYGFVPHGIREAGMFRIPVCSMSEARENWYSAFNGAKPWTNFPCDR